MNVREFYEDAVARRGFTDDPAQQRAVDRLQRLDDDFVAFKKKRANAFLKVLDESIVHSRPPRGVYLWGGVGRGKSFLMDAFYSVVDVRRKTRIHFHEFMRGVHRAARRAEGHGRSARRGRAARRAGSTGSSASTSSTSATSPTR